MYSSNGFVDNDFDTNLAIQDLYSSCLFHFPSPLNYQYEDEAIYLQPDLHDVLCQIDQDIVATKETMAVTANTKSCSQSDVCAGGGISTAQPLVKKKISAKGRHSKINTAHGPRDRRMRLSLEVAHKFFGLQDMLGLDKPSKTLEWLFKQSKNAIMEHTAGGFAQVNKGSSVVIASASSNSDCKIVSGLDESRLKTAATSTKNVLRPSSCCKNKRTRRVIRKPTFHPIPKESREKARERARERTKDKKKQKQLDDRQLTSLITWSSFGTGNEPIGTSYNNINNIKSSLSFDVEQMQNPHEEKMKSLWNREELSTAGDFNLFRNENWSHELFNYIYQQTSEISHEFAGFQL